jgi:hypothetical protein
MVEFVCLRTYSSRAAFKQNSLAGARTFVHKQRPRPLRGTRAPESARTNATDWADPVGPRRTFDRAERRERRKRNRRRLLRRGQAAVAHRMAQARRGMQRGRPGPVGMETLQSVERGALCG